MKKENNLIGLFTYDADKLILKNLTGKVKHIPFIKEIIKFLDIHKDPDVPSLIFNFTNRRFSKGYRSSLLLLLDNYDCKEFIYDLLNLFLKDSYNTTWYCYDILVKYLRNINIKDLNKFSDLISDHISKEKDDDKRQYHYLLLKKINTEIKKRKTKAS